MNSTRWIWRLAARCCAARTMQRLVEPILTDIELEYREPFRSGAVWRARWVLLRGYAGLCRAIAVHAMHVCASAVVPDESARRTMRFSGAGFVLGTLGFILPPLLDAPSVARYPDLVVYLLPQAIPLSIPIALSFGILCGWSRDTTGRGMLRRVLALGIAGALIALATMEWLVPAANQAFRVTVSSRLVEAGHTAPHVVLRGISERSLSELAALVRLTSQTPPFSVSEYERVRLELQGIAEDLTAEDLQLQLHLRVALCFATVLLGFLAVAVANAIRRRTLARGVLAGIALLYLGWFGPVAIGPALPPAVSAWLPNAAVAAFALALFAISSRRRDAREPAG